MHFPQNDATAPVDRPHSSEAGFSVIEGLIAALLLLVVTLGILPLFSRAMNNNLKGNDSTRRSNAAIDSFEAQQGLLFNSGAMTVQPATTETVVLETLALKKIASPSGGADTALSSRWELLADLDTGDVPSLNRQTTLRQYAFDDFNDNQTFDNPLDGDTEPRLVHLKVFDVELQDASGDANRTYRLRTIRSY